LWERLQSRFFNNSGVTIATKRKSLGRGLDALLSHADIGVAGAGGLSAREATLRELPVDLVQPGRYHPRKDLHPDKLQELADSIRAQGVVQPIVVRPIANERYEIVAGERRWRAAQLAGLHEVPAVVRDIPDRAAVAMALIENVQRENLNPLEEAAALERLIDEFGMTHQQVAEAVGRSRAAVSNLLRLLELGAEARKLVETGKLEMGHARALLALPRTAQGEAARRVVAKGLSVRATEQLVRRLLSPAGERAAPVRRLDPDVRRLQDDLGERLGAAVSV
jgi:ParB family chromosome partitioning protein